MFSTDASVSEHPGTPHANLLNEMLDVTLNLGLLDGGDLRRSVKDMLLELQVDLDNPASVQRHVEPLRKVAAVLKAHLDSIHRVAGEACNEARG